MGKAGLIIAVSLGLLLASCGQPATVEPTQAPSLPSTPEPQRSPPVQATATAIAEGYEPHFDADLQLSFIRPSGWDLDKGSRTLPQTKGTELFVAFSRVRTGEYKVISLKMIEQPTLRGVPEEPEELMEDMLHVNETRLRESGADILEKLRTVTVDGKPAAGIIYRATDPRGVRFFSILLAVSKPGRGYVFQWGSSIEYEDELKKVYETMLPTIKFKG